MESVVRALRLATQTQDSICYSPPVSLPVLDFGLEFFPHLSEIIKNNFFISYSLVSMVHNKTVIQFSVGEGWWIFLILLFTSTSVNNQC